MKELMREAHKMAKEIKAEFPSVDYKAQLGICMRYLIEEGKGDSKMKELKGSEKQIKWAEDIRREMLENIDKKMESLREFQVKKGQLRGVFAKMKKSCEELSERIKIEDSAKWYIDNDSYTSMVCVASYNRHWK